jgi:hypothetical protein
MLYALSNFKTNLALYTVPLTTVIIYMNYTNLIIYMLAYRESNPRFIILFMIQIFCRLRDI